MSFGKWYEQKQQAPNNGDGGGSNDSAGGLASFFSISSGNASNENDDGGDVESQSLIGSFNIASMRSSLEAQLPQKVMGMNYQQRFQAFSILLLLSALFFALGFFVGIPLIT